MSEQLNVVMVCSESRNLAKVGGLGDVVYDLSRALTEKGSRVSVLIPYYKVIDVDSEQILVREVEFSGKRWRVEIHHYQEDGIDFYLIDNGYFFSEKYGEVYIDSSKENKGPFEDDAKRFAFFSTAVIDLCSSKEILGEIDVIHCHDWHTGVLFLLLNYDERYKELKGRTKTLFSIHNLDYQGMRPYLIYFPEDKLSLNQWHHELFVTLKEEGRLLDYSNITNLERLDASEVEQYIFTNIDYPEYLFFDTIYEKDEVENCYCLKKGLSAREKTTLIEVLLDSFYFSLNPMRSAIKLADKVNTVSKTYSYEITQPDNPEKNFIGGRGLERDLQEVYRQDNMVGILNGLDYNIYDPMKLHNPYSSEMDGFAEQKQKNKCRFLDSLPELIEQTYSRIGKRFQNYRQVSRKVAGINFDEWKDSPLLISIGRAANQKLGLIFEKMARRERVLSKLLKKDIKLIFIATGELYEQLKDINNFDNGIYMSAFDIELGNLLYSVGDLFLMPSYFEPCGISQMIAMRFGCLPIANDIGGLHDTIDHMKTGFLFSGKSRDEMKQAMLDAVDGAVDVFKNDRDHWRSMQKMAMEQRFVWEDSAAKYMELYKSLKL